MANMDSSVPGYHRTKPISTRDVERLKKGGEKAEKIKQQKEKHHKDEEIPEAERILEEEIKKLDNL